MPAQPSGLVPTGAVAMLSAMLHLRVFGPTATMDRVVGLLESEPGARQLVRTPGALADEMLVTAQLGADAVDRALNGITALGVPPADMAVTRMEVLAPISRHSPSDGIVWAELHGAARINARPFGRFLVFMAVAGVIACFGVLDNDVILTVGAMAVSPDLLPVTAACTGIILRRPELVVRALRTLVLGLLLTGTVACAITLVLNLFGGLPANFDVRQVGSLEGLTTVGVETVLVALACGVAGMVAQESRASSAVGVAISVTTIPAAAFLGVSVAVGQSEQALGALAVLVVNVTMLLVGGTLTLAVQREIRD